MQKGLSLKPYRTEEIGTQMLDIYEHKFVVGKESIDVFHHVNNREYLRWMEEAATEHATALGFGARTLLMRQQVWVARQHWIEYLRPTYEGDELTIYSWVDSWQASRSLRRYAIKRGDQLVCVGATMWVFIDFKTGLPIEVPDDVKSCFTVIDPESERLKALGISRPIRYKP